jgi:hypothetical protein
MKIQNDPVALYNASKKKVFNKQTEDSKMVARGRKQKASLL